MSTPADDLPAPPGESVVEPLPARMLNEFVYCPRLFYSKLALLRLLPRLPLSG